MDSRCAVRDLPTAPRLGAFGLTRLRLPIAVQIKVTINTSEYTKPDAIGAPGLPLLVVAVCRQESIEFFAGRVKRTLLLLGEATMDQWSLIIGNGFTDQLFNGSLSELWRVIDVSNDFTPEQRQVVAVQVAGLA